MLNQCSRNNEGFQNKKDKKDKKEKKDKKDKKEKKEKKDDESDDDGNDEEGNDEEGEEGEDSFVVTDDKNEIVEGFQNNNNTIEYQTGAKSYLSFRLTS